MVQVDILIVLPLFPKLGECGKEESNHDKEVGYLARAHGLRELSFLTSTSEEEGVLAYSQAELTMEQNKMTGDRNKEKLVKNIAFRYISGSNT